MKRLVCLCPTRQSLRGSPCVQQHGIWELLRQLLPREVVSRFWSDLGMQSGGKELEGV